jgi:membrane-associated phospholipid phosphatase
VLDWGTIVTKFIGGNDLFFSGHTGAPFLLALIFWRIPPLRYLFLAWSLFFAVIVLLGHLHYTIDVLSAFFITYTIFHMSEFFFKTYQTIFRLGPQPRDAVSVR